MDPADLQWLVTTVGSFLSLCELGIAVTTASVCCCCSPLQVAKVHILFADPADRQGPPSPPKKLTDPYFPPRHALPFPRKAGRRRPRLKEATVQTDPAPPSLPVMTILPPNNAASLPPVQRLVDPRYPILHRAPGADEDEESEGEGEGEGGYSPGSHGYDRLRRWALPNHRLY
ncbi:hypothetical protein ACOMHN_013330 [Nucella lapillus]